MLGLAIFAGLLSVYIITGCGGGKAAVVNNTVYPVEGLRVVYLYPARCAECDLAVPGQCSYCNSYYDLRLMDLLSQEVGVPVEFAVSDIVSKPNVFVVDDGRATLGDARTRWNIANTLCRFAGVEKSCQLFNEELDRVRNCIADYGVDENQLIYHTSSRNCPVCTRTDGIIEDLVDLEYNDTLMYSVYTVDHADPGERKMITECMQAFDYVDYAPQLLCPASGRDLTGDFTLGRAREFADQCIEAG